MGMELEDGLQVAYKTVEHEVMADLAVSLCFEVQLPAFASCI
jgi:hypothetical protein